MKRTFTVVAVICALFAVLAPATFAEAKTLKMYIPNAYVKESQQAQGFQAAVDQIKKDTNGRVDIKIYYIMVDSFAAAMRTQLTNAVTGL